MRIFGKHARETALLWIQSARGDTLFRGDARDFDLPEARVLGLSVEFFRDPAPCEIHRGAVRERAFQEIELALSQAGGGAIALGALPERIRGFLGAYPDDATARVMRERGA